MNVPTTLFDLIKKGLLSKKANFRKAWFPGILFFWMNFRSIQVEKLIERHSNFLNRIFLLWAVLFLNRLWMRKGTLQVYGQRCWEFHKWGEKIIFLNLRQRILKKNCIYFWPLFDFLTTVRNTEFLSFFRREGGMKRH